MTQLDTMHQINELTGAVVVTKGIFVAPGQPLPEGERKLYLLIEGATEMSVRNATSEIKRILEEAPETITPSMPPGGSTEDDC